MKFHIELSFETDNPNLNDTRKYIMDAIIHHQSRYKVSPIEGLDEITVLTDTEYENIRGIYERN